MIEGIIVGAIVMGAVVWLALWFRGTAKGTKGCACGGCDKKCAMAKEGEATKA